MNYVRSVEHVVHDTKVDFLVKLLLFAIKDYFVESVYSRNETILVSLGQMLVIALKHGFH